MGGSSSKQNKLFDKLFDNAIQMVKELMDSESMDAVFESTMNGDMEAVNAMKAEQEAKSAEMNKGVLEELWDEFDADSNGILSQEENRELVAKYLAAAKVHWPKLLEESMRMSAEYGFAIMKDIDPDTYKELKKELTKTMKKVRKRLTRQVGALIEDLETNVDQTADSLYEQMDIDGDGSVDKDEFIARFLTATSSILQPEQFDMSDVMGDDYL